MAGRKLADKTERGTRQTAVRLTPTRLAKLTQAARSAGMSRNQFVSTLIDGLPTTAGKENATQQLSQ